MGFLDFYALSLIKLEIALQAIYYSLKATFEPQSIKRLEYKGKSWGLMSVARGEIELPSELVRRYLPIYKAIIIFIVFIACIGIVRKFI